jgi:serine/threonine-protein kinase RsbW
MNHYSDIAVNRFPADDGGGKQDNIGEMVRVCIPGSPAYICIVRDAVDALADRISLSAEDRAAVKLAVGEACNNAVQHGPQHADGRHRMVDVALRIGPESLEIDVANEGTGLHTGRHASMPVAEMLAEHGRGLPLIELMMDSVEYLTHEGNTVVRMRKRHRPMTPKILAD